MPNPSGVVVVPTDAYDALLQSLEGAEHTAAKVVARALAGAEVVQRGPTPAINLSVPDAATARNLMAVFARLADAHTGARATVLRRVRDRFRDRAEVLARQEKLVRKFRDWRNFRTDDDPPPPVPTTFLTEMLAAGMNAEEVGKVVGMSRAGVYKRVRGYGKERTL